MKVRALQSVRTHILDDYDNKGLKPNETYDVLGIDHDCFRIVNEAGEPILYPKFLFEVVETSIPDTWIRQEYSSDEYYINPREFSEPGFYEDLFDGVPEARAIYNNYLISAGINKKTRAK